jgi:hypothetical protein
LWKRDSIQIWRRRRRRKEAQGTGHRAQGAEHRAQGKAKRLRDLGTKRPDFKLRRSELFVVQGISLENAPEQKAGKYEVTNTGAMETYLNANSQTLKNH